jgi:NADH-quinone oxidoreductase subunit E
MLRGSEALIELCKHRIHPEPLHPNAEGTLSWEEVECQGACVNAPMVMIFKDAYEDLTPERLAEIIDAFEAGDGDAVKPGPQIDRIYAAPASGLTSLTDEKNVIRVNGRTGTKARPRATGEESAVPPSQAAKPKTDAPETSPALKSPSPVKAPVNGEKQTSAQAPAHDAKAADSTAPQAETVARPRAHAKGKDNAPAAGLMQTGKPGRAEKPSLDSADRPRGMERPAQPDDLKLISGVGPKNEATLHSLGIFTWAQVAAWEKRERDWVDSYLSFHGRIEREDWVGQAAALARGGEAEYVRVFGKKPR